VEVRVDLRRRDLEMDVVGSFLPGSLSSTLRRGLLSCREGVPHAAYEQRRPLQYFTEQGEEEPWERSRIAFKASPEGASRGKKRPSSR